MVVRFGGLFELEVLRGIEHGLLDLPQSSFMPFSPIASYRFDELIRDMSDCFVCS